MPLPPAMPRGRPCQSARKVTNRAADHARDLAALQGPGDEGPIGGIALTPGTAVLVIDVQPVYWSEVPEARGAFPDLPRNMARLLATARGRGAKVVHVRASYAFNRSSWLQQFAALHPERERVEVEPMDGEPWAAPAPGETVVVKDNFNAFLSVSGAAPGEDLACMLRAMGVDTVLVCGLITSVCVNHTAYGSMLHGFRTAIVSECCGDRTLERHRAALSLYVGYLFPDVTLDNLDRAAAREDDAFASGLNAWAERVAPPSLWGAPAPESWTHRATPHRRVCLSRRRLIV